MKTLIRDAARRATNLTPFDAGTLRGDYAAVCTPAQSVPTQLRRAHMERHDAYMNGQGRTTPDHAPRYFVTSKGQLIAWVTLDGRTHYTSSLVPLARKHQDMVRAAWPTRFAVTADFGG